MMTWVVLRDSSFCARLVRKTLTKIGFCKHTPTSWFYILTLSLLLWSFTPRIILLRFLQRCEQWDVNNENLHETFYADLADDDTITQQMFEQIHVESPRDVLCRSSRRWYHHSTNVWTDPCVGPWHTTVHQWLRCPVRGNHCNSVYKLINSWKKWRLRDYCIQYV